MTTIKLKNGSGAPAGGDLVQGEPALDLTNKRLYTENGSGTVIEVGTNPTSITTGDITATGTASFANLATTGNITFGDDDKAIFGAGSDLQIYHDGSGSYIVDNGTGNLQIDANDFRVRKPDGSEAMIHANADGAVKLFYDGGATPKLETTSTGIDVTGSVVDIVSSATGGTTIELDNTSTGGRNFTLYSSGSGNSFGAGKFALYDADAAAVRMLVDSSGNVGIGTSSPNTYSSQTTLTINGSTYGRLDLESAGTLRASLFATAGSASLTTSTDVLSFDTSGGEAMRIDSSGNVGIGVSSVSSALHVAGSTGITLGAIASNTWQTTAIKAIDEGASFKGALAFYTHPSAGSAGSPTERMRIDASGNVGIGTSSPSGKLHVKASSGFATGYVQGSNSSSGMYLFDQGSEAGLWKVDLGYLAFGTNNTERMRIDSSGVVKLITANDTAGTEKFLTFGTNSFNRAGIKCTNAATYDGSLEFYTGNSTDFDERARIDKDGNLLVGKTSTTLNTAGTYIAPSGVIVATRDSNEVLALNLTNSDGNIASFYKDGTAVGRIGTNGGDLTIGTGDTGLTFEDAADVIHPINQGTGAARDNAIDLGKSAARFKDLHLSGTPYIGGTSAGQSVIQMLANPTNGANTIHFGDSASGSDTYAGYINYAHDSNSMQFATNQLERMRLDSSGNLLVGKTVNNTFNEGLVAKAAGGANITSNGNTALDLNRRNSDGTVINFRKDNTSVGSISVTSSATTYNTSSDRRLKDNIVDAPSASDDIDAIQVRSFDWKADGSHQKYGMVAQELQSVAPEAVTGDADSDDMMGVDYSKLVPMMLKEIQSLRARVAQLEGEA